MLCMSVVGERSVDGEGYGVSRTGVDRSEKAGMSNEIPMRNRNAENPRFPTQRSSSWGESGPNMSQALPEYWMDNRLIFLYSETFVITWGLTKSE